MAREKLIPFPKEREVLALMDEEDHVTGYLTLKRKNYLGKGWVAMYQDGLAWMAKQDLTGEQLRVFMQMTASLDFDNYLRVKQSDIAEQLHIPRTNVSRAIRRLKELEIILEGPMAGSCKTYRLNPYVGHKGKNFQKTVVDFDDLRKMRDGRRQEQD